MLRASFYLPMMLGLSTLLGCQQRPLTPEEIGEQHRFEVGCRNEDAQGYERNMPYCHRDGGGARMHP